MDEDAALAADIRAVIGKLKRRFQTGTGAENLTGAQITVLSRLERDGPATVTLLAQAEGMRSQSMGAIVAVLEAAGHVAGVPDPADGRRTILSLTPACRDWIGTLRAARQDWLVGLIAAELSPEERRQLAMGVRLLTRLADSGSERAPG